jgi:hypothetical protein
MPEASQRVTETARPAKPLPKSLTRQVKVRTENLKPLAFKVPPAFCKRFKQCALSADLKLNELLFETLDAWEEKQKLKK